MPDMAGVYVFSALACLDTYPAQWEWRNLYLIKVWKPKSLLGNMPLKNNKSRHVKQCGGFCMVWAELAIAAMKKT